MNVDQTLLIQYRDGDPQAVSHIVDLYHTPPRAFVIRMGCPPTDADDIFGWAVYLVARSRRIRCPGCGVDQDGSFSVCPACGHRPKEICPACGDQVRREWRFCAHCGRELVEGE